MVKHIIVLNISRLPIKSKDGTRYLRRNIELHNKVQMFNWPARKHWEINIHQDLVWIFDTVINWLTKSIVNKLTINFADEIALEVEDRSTLTYMFGLSSSTLCSLQCFQPWSTSCSKQVMESVLTRLNQGVMFLWIPGHAAMFSSDPNIPISDQKCIMLCSY